MSMKEWSTEEHRARFELVQMRMGDKKHKSNQIDDIILCLSVGHRPVDGREEVEECLGEKLSRKHIKKMVDAYLEHLSERYMLNSWTQEVGVRYVQNGEIPEQYLRWTEKKGAVSLQDLSFFVAKIWNYKGNNKTISQVRNLYVDGYNRLGNFARNDDEYFELPKLGHKAIVLPEGIWKDTNEKDKVAKSLKNMEEEYIRDEIALKVMNILKSKEYSDEVDWEDEKWGMYIDEMVYAYITYLQERLFYQLQRYVQSNHIFSKNRTKTELDMFHDKNTEQIAKTLLLFVRSEWNYDYAKADDLAVIFNIEQDLPKLCNLSKSEFLNFEEVK